MKGLECLSKLERFSLVWTGRIIIAIGLGAMCLTIGFDNIARGTPLELGWIQTLGIFCELGMILYGFFLEVWLGEVRTIIKDYLER